MSKITNFATLVAAVKDFADRTDMTDAQAELFIQLGEDRINDLLRVYQMEASTTIPVNSSGVGTLPTDFLEMKVVYDSDNVVLPQITPEFLVEMPTGGKKSYTLLADTLRTAPPEAEDITIVYYAKVPNLNSSDTTNWLLTLKPSIYFYAAMLSYAVWRDEDAEIGKWDGALNRAIAELDKAEKRGRYSGPVWTRPPVAQVRGYRA